jgi:hypothetical protein
VKGQ